MPSCSPMSSFYSFAQSLQAVLVISAVTHSNAVGVLPWHVAFASNGFQSMLIADWKFFFITNIALGKCFHRSLPSFMTTTAICLFSGFKLYPIRKNVHILQHTIICWMVNSVGIVVNSFFTKFPLSLIDWSDGESLDKDQSGIIGFSVNKESVHKSVVNTYDRAAKCRVPNYMGELDQDNLKTCIKAVNPDKSAKLRKLFELSRAILQCGKYICTTWGA